MQPFFLPGERGQCFCLYHTPADVSLARGAVIYLHPFAEEMNKARRMAALQSRAMVAAGFAVLQIDLLGCGDSAGDFSDATWSAWQEDVLRAYRWLRTQTKVPLTLWGVRGGCLLAASAAVHLPEKANFIFWQPATSGKQHWQQFMRLKMAGELASGQSRGITEQLRRQLAAGEAVEIAGYTVSPALAEGLEAAELEPPARGDRQVIWLETSLRDDATLAPVSQNRIEHWLTAGYAVHAKVVRGPAFWQTSEIEDAPELLAATQAALASLT
ncbi:MAG: hydrolase 2, exosortase A system-associated [Dechloromonas sp.]|uniref:hydrolase 2, exosortase A system-associated n=1 Tax=Dechloromonas sp. TaxID=1917218 RepID=UPI0027F8005B|nr:hydrolase 2, exosortase A system-associated [Dechloromonas sp.]MBT9521471.1 hydrolase 2, exosortase A system-associated [Dechloromonas sp.]